MNATIAIGIFILSIVLFYQYKPKESELKTKVIETTKEENISIEENKYQENINKKETESTVIIEELKKINQTLSFFRDIITIIIIFTVIKYIVIIIFFTKTASNLSEVLNTIFR